MSSDDDSNNPKQVHSVEVLNPSHVVPENLEDIMDFQDSVNENTDEEPSANGTRGDLFLDVFSNPDKGQESLKPHRSKMVLRPPVVATSQAYMAYLNAKEQEKEAIEREKIRRREEREKKKKEQEIKKKEKKIKVKKCSSKTPKKKINV